MVALDGVPVLVDPGRPTYTAQTFGPDRYAIWTMQSGWHNTPTIRGTTQAPGRTFAARDVTATVDDDRVIVILDLAGAYPRSDVRRWQRTAVLERGRGRVTVTDAWRFEPSDVDRPTLIHWVVAGEVRVEPGCVEVTALDGAGRATLTWQPGSAPCVPTVRRLDDPMLSGVWGDQLTRIDIDVTGLGSVGTSILTVEEAR